MWMSAGFCAQSERRQMRVSQRRSYLHQPAAAGRSPGRSGSRSPLDVLPGAEIDVGEPLGIAVGVGENQMKGAGTGHSMDERKFALLSLQLGGLQVEGRCFAPGARRGCIEVEPAGLSG